jgi:CDP-diacylglycerol pyrophosphatase
MSSVSEGFVLRKVTSFAATMGLILATIANLPNSASAANRGGLWAVVRDICVPAYQSIGVGFPCSEVSIADGLERGFAVLRAPSSATHVIVVPTTPISGIESPALLRENAPNYWEAARRFVEEGARCGLLRLGAVARAGNQTTRQVEAGGVSVESPFRQHTKFDWSRSTR